MFRRRGPDGPKRGRGAPQSSSERDGPGASPRTGANDGIDPDLEEALAALKRYDASGDTAYRDHAIEAARRATTGLPPESDHRVSLLVFFLPMLWRRVTDAPTVQDAAECTGLYREVLNSPFSMNHPQLRVICAHHLAVSHWILHDRGGAPEHAEQAADAALDLLDACVAAKEPDPLMSAAELLTTAMNRLPAGHHSHKRLVLARGAALMWWMKVTGDPGPLEAADEDIRRAVHLCHPEDPFYREVLISLADLVGLRLTFEAGSSRT